MGCHFALTGRAHAEAFFALGENDGGLALVPGCGVIGCVDLDQVVPTALELIDLLIGESLQGFESRVCACDEVVECYLMTGDADYLIRVAMPDVEKIRSSFALKQLCYKTALPVR